MTRDASVDSPDRTPSRVRGVMSTCSRTRSAGWRMPSCLETCQLALTRAAEVTDIPGNRFRYQICPGVLPWKAPVRQPGDGRLAEVPQNPVGTLGAVMQAGQRFEDP